MPDLDQRAARHAALGEPIRLAIVDELTRSDRAPVELAELVGVESNLLAHHLDVLERVGFIERARSSGDGRRRYVHLRHDALDDPRPALPLGPALFVCSANSARSQLAAALWNQVTGFEAASAGTHPAEAVHPGAVAAATRADLRPLVDRPRSIDDVATPPALVVTVCDQAHEALDPAPTWLHWSVADPVAIGTTRAFDATVTELRRRIDAVTAPRSAA